MIKFPIPTNIIQSKIKKGYKSNCNKGLAFEDEINNANNYYNNHNIALIYKRPTPIHIVNVDYSKNMITKAFFEKQSTTDYNGIYRKKYIDFEAKSTYNSSLPLHNIKSHQIDHLRKVEQFDGIAFFIIKDYRTNDSYIFPFSLFDTFIKNNSRQSIPFNYIKENGVIIKTNNNILDFLSAVDEFYFSS